MSECKKCAGKDIKDMTFEEKYADVPEYVKIGLENAKKMEYIPAPPPPISFPAPTLSTKIHNLIDFAKQVAEDKLEGKQTFCSKEKFDQRMSICTNCVYVSKDKSTCNACGCYLNVKLKFIAATCPNNFW